jgi:hypothetical protein
MRRLRGFAERNIPRNGCSFNASEISADAH